MARLSDFFDDFDSIVSGDNIVVCEKPTLILAITARTGSTQLCSVLESLNIFGSADEIFNPRGVINSNIKRLGVNSFAEYIDKLVHQSGDFFSFKTSWSDFEPISTFYMRIFPNAHFIFLDRFDIVAQALSLFKAIVTERWHCSSQSKSKKIELTLEQLDADRITSLMQRLMHEKFQWEWFFYNNDLRVRHLYYEIIRNDWGKAARMIAEQFGYHDVEPENGKFLCLSQESDKQLVDQFKKERGYSWLSI